MGFMCPSLGKATELCWDYYAYPLRPPQINGIATKKKILLLASNMVFPFTTAGS